MRSHTERKAVGSALLVSLLLLAQWTAFLTFLCVSGTDHIQVEPVGSFCCAPRTTGGAGIYGDSRGCAGCTDIPMQITAVSDSSHRFHDDGLPALPGAGSWVHAVRSAPGKFGPGTAERSPDTPFSPTVPLRC